MATITTIGANDLPTNSRTDINNNFANLNSDKIETSYIDTDTTLAANSDTKIPSQKAVKAYIDAGGSTEVPAHFVDTSAGATDAGKGVKLNSSGLLGTTLMQSIVKRTYDTAASPATWSKPTNLNAVLVQVWGSGGGGGSGSSKGGGGGGAFKEAFISASVLGTTETVTIGAGGNAGSAGNTSSFGSWVVAYGGGAGALAGGGGGGNGAVGSNASSGTGGAGGGFLGGAAGATTGGISTFGGGGGTGEVDGGTGGDSIYGGGGGVGNRSGGSSPNRAGNSTWGGGGGAGAGTAQTAGTSVFGGAGGAGGSAGSVPGGGGGANAAGGNGRVIVYEFY